MSCAYTSRCGSPKRIKLTPPSLPPLEEYIKKKKMTIARRPQHQFQRGLGIGQCVWLILCAVRGSVSARNPIEPMMMIADEAEEKKKRKKKLGECWLLGNGAGIPSIPSSFFFFSACAYAGCISP